MSSSFLLKSCISNTVKLRTYSARCIHLHGKKMCMWGHKKPDIGNCWNCFGCFTTPYTYYLSQTCVYVVEEVRTFNLVGHMSTVNNWLQKSATILTHISQFKTNNNWFKSTGLKVMVDLEVDFSVNVTYTKLVHPRVFF